MTRLPGDLGPGYPEQGGFGDMFKSLERRLGTLERSARLPLSSIGSGGLTIKDGGQIRVLDASGNVQITLDVDGLKVDGGSVLATVPPGNIEATARSTAPDGWLMCNGAAVSRTTFADLFDAIGTAYGAGDGSTTFNVPNLQQKFPLGKAASGTGSVLGETGGAINHAHTGPSHAHTGPSHTHGQGNTGAAGGHTHTSDGAHTGHGQSSSLTANVSTASADFTVRTSGHTHPNSAGGHTHNSISDHSHTNPDTGPSGTGNTGPAGTGNTGTANPPYTVVNYIIKV